MHDEGLDPLRDPRRGEGPSAERARIYFISAGLILLPIIGILIFLGPKARFETNPGSERTAWPTDPVIVASRFPPEPDEREAPAETPTIATGKIETHRSESASQPTPRIGPPPSPEDAGANADSNLIVLSTEASTSVFLFPASRPDRWNPGTHPAPIDRVYLRVRLELELVSGRDVHLTFNGLDSQPSDVIFKTDNGEVISALGTVEDPPNLIAPISTAPISITGDAPVRELILAAIVPVSAETIECKITSDLTVTFRPETSEVTSDEHGIQIDSLTGTWTKAEAQSWRTRYPDRLVDRIRRNDQRRLLVTANPDRRDEFMVDFPVCDISGSARALKPDQAEYWRMELNHQGVSKTLPARLVADGTVLILYFGDTPYDCFVYTR